MPARQPASRWCNAGGRALGCMFSPAEVPIILCDPQRLRGLEATICTADCASVIVKALKEGKHHGLLIQQCLRDQAKAAKRPVWPEAAVLPDNLELELAAPVTA